MNNPTVRPPNNVQQVLDDLMAAEDNLRNLREAYKAQPGDKLRGGLARAFAKRGFLKTNLGADREGLRDLLSSHALHYEYGDYRLSSLEQLLTNFQKWESARYDLKAGEPGAEPLQMPSPDWCPDAELGEALRIFARDTLLAMKPDDAVTPQTLVSVLISAIRSFDRAQLNCETINDKDMKDGSVRSARAWIAAHRGACYTHFYFLRRSAFNKLDDATSERLYREAEMSFTIALEERVDYDWALKFKAFLLVLRGGPREDGRMSDFRRARNLLRVIDGKTAKGAEQTSLARSKAMLLSYDVGQNWARMQAKDGDEDAARRDGIEAAEKSVAWSLQAVREDPEDFVAAYFGVVSTWFLSRAGSSKDGYYKAALESAMNSAKTRAHNSFSQALAVLTGLEDLERQIALEAKREPAPESAFQRLLRREEFGLDWETRAIFVRDPLNQLLDAQPERDDVRARYAMPVGFTDGVIERLGLK